jgi:hypothetical protein
MTRVLISGVIAIAAASASGGPFELVSSTVDGGGGTLTGTHFELQGTIGQHDAGGVLAGSFFESRGGFWAAAGPSGCGLADVAPPIGVLDLTDINVFINGFLNMSPEADIAPPFGVLDLSDINVFVASFLAGCP